MYMYIAPKYLEISKFLTEIVRIYSLFHLIFLAFFFFKFLNTRFPSDLHVHIPFFHFLIIIVFVFYHRNDIFIFAAISLRLLFQFLNTIPKIRLFNSSIWV